MPWAPAYATLADLKASLRINDTEDDAELLYALNAASRVIDHHTGRQFGSEDAASARYYWAYWHRGLERWVVDIDDLVTTTDLVVKTDDGSGDFATTLTLDDDFRLAPDNAAADGRPWTQLIAASGQSLPTAARTVEVTARWGWSAPPEVVVQATLIQAARLFKRKDAPFGVAGSLELGSEVRLLARLDPDVEKLLEPVTRWRPFQ